jgi:histidyl-tRNA synthetase
MARPKIKKKKSGKRARIERGKKRSTSPSLVSKNISEKAERSEPFLLQTVRGMKDILPEEQSYWDQVRRVSERLSRDYGFLRLDLPLVEYSNLFIRSIGEGTDIVDKEIYSFTTRGGDKVALRPEMTAGICRSYIEHGMNVLPKPIKLFSTGPVYRYDRPQEGRYREHYQINFDAFGEQDSILDAQMIQVAHRLMQGLGIRNVQIQINSIGCPVCRKHYRDVLIQYLESKKQKFCQDCKRRLETNPLRILDCKEDKCFQVSSTAPQSLDHLCEECRVHFKSLLEYLDELELPYIINPRLVRGLDYYTKTVFEIWSGVEGGKKSSLGGGGRYDGLIKSLGGEDTPAVGFAVGIERIILEMKKVQARPYRSPKPRVFLAQLGNMAKKKSLRLFSELEKNGILMAESFGRGSLKSQLKLANKLGVEMTLILGQKEVIDQTVIVKDMVTGAQETVATNKLVDLVKRKLKTENIITYHNGTNHNNTNF